MIRSRLRRRVTVPAISTRKTQSKDYEFKKGLNSNLSNDDIGPDQWRYITDAREIEVGKWKTRQGNDFLSVPIGEAVNVQQTSVTGASTFSFNATTRFAAKLVATSTGRLSAIEANISNANSASGTIVLALYSDSGGSPGTELMRTTIANSVPTASLAYCKGRTISAVDITNGTTYWVVGFVQDGGTGSYVISTTTTGGTGKSSTNSGSTWSAASVDFNVKLSTATATGGLGHIRVKRSNGTTTLFMAHGTTLYTVNETTGVTTAVDTGLGVGTTRVRFAFVNDVLYYVCVGGSQKPRQYDFSTAAEMTTAPENADNVIEHKGILFFHSATDPSKYFYTNFAAYSTFTSTDFAYVPAPKTSDPINAMAKLNGNLYFITRNNKYVLFGAENATFRLDEAIARKGTFSQESMAYDEQAIYLAGDDGIYRFNGAEEKNIAEDVLNWWIDVTTKSNTVLELWNNRLYVFYSAAGSAMNNRCRVYNTLYGIWESEDLNTWVGSTYTRYDQDNYFIQGSNRIGMLMLGERSTNDYTNMGEPFTLELRTAYQHFDAPAQLKRCPVFRPHFDSVSGNYTVDVGYATDYSESPSYTQISLQASGVTWNSGVTFNSGAVFGSPEQINPLDSSLAIPGEWRRLQIRYKHYAAREPVNFDGHVIEVEAQRVI